MRWNHTMLASVVAAAGLVGGWTPSAGAADYLYEVSVNSGDKIWLKAGCQSAEFDLLADDHSAYKRGCRLRSSYEYFPVYRDGYAGIIYGDVRVSTRSRGNCEMALEAQLAGDFDGDRLADPGALVNGDWLLWLSGSGYQLATNLPDTARSGGGFAGGDFDGDRRLDGAMTVGGIWYVWLSSAQYAEQGPFALGGEGDIALAGDFDGDGLADPVMVAADTLTIWMSTLNYQPQGPFTPGVSLLTPACGDLDGDGLADLAALIDTAWYVLFSSGNYQPQGPFDLGVSGMPVIADFDGDSKGDPGVYDFDGLWHVWLSSTGYTHTSMGPLGSGRGAMVAALVVGTPSNAYAVAYASDGVNEIKDAKIYVNNSLLTYNLALALTNALGATTNYVSVYQGEVAGARTGSAVRVCATNAAGQSIYQSPVYTIPAQVLLTAPTNGQVLPAGQNVAFAWTAASGAAGYLVNYLAPDADADGDSGAYVAFVPSPDTVWTMPGSNTVAGNGMFGVTAYAGDVGILTNGVDPTTSYLLVASDDSIVASVQAAAAAQGAKASQGLTIAREYTKSEQGLRFTIRETNPEQIQQAGTVTMEFKLRRFKMSVAFVKAFEPTGAEYYSWEKKRIFKTSNKNYTVTFAVRPGSLIVIGTHDACYRGGTYSY